MTAVKDQVLTVSHLESLGTLPQEIGPGGGYRTEVKFTRDFCQYKKTVRTSGGDVDALYSFLEDSPILKALLKAEIVTKTGRRIQQLPIPAADTAPREVGPPGSYRIEVKFLKDFENFKAGNIYDFVEGSDTLKRMLRDGISEKTGGRIRQLPIPAGA